MSGLGRPVILDLFCGAGGCSTGYHRAGFDVIGVDIKPQPAREAVGRTLRDTRSSSSKRTRSSGLRASTFDAIHASPPCQHYANVTAWRGNQDDHPDLLDRTRELLSATGLPWVIENVPEAPIRRDFLLCGSMFGLKVRRHRAFETNWHDFDLRMACGDHTGLLPFMHKGERAYADAMGCEWMTNREAREAIPPAYTEHIGFQLRAALMLRPELEMAA